MDAEDRRRAIVRFAKTAWGYDIDPLQVADVVLILDGGQTKATPGKLWGIGRGRVSNPTELARCYGEVEQARLLTA